jgi:hypothetical protein
MNPRGNWRCGRDSRPQRRTDRYARGNAPKPRRHHPFGQKGSQIMSKSKTSTTVTSSNVTDQLGAIEKDLTDVVSLTKQERKQLEARSRNVPDALIQKMIQVARNNGGVVAGMPFDVDAASTALTEVSNAQAAADSSRTIAQKMVDSSVQQRVVVADRAFAIYRALGRLVKTPEGNSLLRTYEDMASTVKNRPRIPRKKKTAESPATTAAATETTTSQAPSPAQAEPAAPAAAAATAASGASHS